MSQYELSKTQNYKLMNISRKVRHMNDEKPNKLEFIEEVS